MIKLNRTTEYGLMALRLMDRKSRESNPVTELTSAREVADVFGLPFEITAKTLQRMKEIGLIESAQGARGGYVLLRKLEEITLADFLEMMEGPQAVVACASHLPLKVKVEGSQAGGCGCEYEPRCGIKGLMTDLNTRVHSFLSGIRLADLSDDSMSAEGLKLDGFAQEP